MIYQQIATLFVGGMISGIALGRELYEKNPPAYMPYLAAGGLMLSGLAAVGILT